MQSEAAARIELAHKCFADTCVSTSPRGRLLVFYHTTLLNSVAMRVVKTLFVVLVSLSILVFATLFLVGYFRVKPGGILVDTSPMSSVYINGVLVGKTPYVGTREAGQITLKLVPDNVGQELVPYETKITLVSGVQTVVRRAFAQTEEESSGDVISFEKEVSEKASLIVVSIPENAEVSIDGVSRGFSPFKISSILPAQHQITVRAPGYTDRTMICRTQLGYRLTVFAKLAKTSEVDESSMPPSPTPQPTTYVQILSTSTGFLRVRTQPGIAGEEIAEVKPGEKYLYLDEDVATGWFEIQYKDPAPGLPNGMTGWVSGQFAKKIEE
jgi:hypothetical protein